ncbi:MAG TPA: DciA family protein [Candidatus Pacearchaeota archaeon]|nr:DciA family protein [Candidatus Pacearchaeota archaeon]HOK93919.1 DciA family protein [Candidatus Pacearchaeota archaeon]HPO74990.1 DciA family protein [Candidatus Pacearchaeota archaeon]
MEWKSINEVLKNVNKRASFKKGLQTSLLKKILQKKFQIDDISLEEGILSIKTKNSTLAQDLNFQKEELKGELNKALGEEKIKEIIIKVV